MAAADVLRRPPFDEALYLVDVSAFVFRFYYSIRGLATSKGEATGAVFGVARMLHKLIADHSPRLLAIAMDSRTPTFRREAYPAYKANRPPPPEDLAPQFGFVREILDAFSIPALQRDGFEADDVIATAVRRAAPERPVVIIGSDKDLCQLVSDRVLILAPDKDELIGPAEVEAKWGVPPERMVDLQALVGDASDNVPGVPGIGPKTAAQLICEFGSLDALLARAAEVRRPKTRDALLAGADAARLARTLVTLRDDVPLDIDMEALRYVPAPAERLRRIFARFEFHSLVQSLPGDVDPDRDYAAVTTLDELDSILARALDRGVLSVDTETTGLDPMRAEIVGVALCTDKGTARYVPVGHVGPGSEAQLPRDEVFRRLAPILADPAIAKVGQNLKYDSILLRRAGAPLAGVAFDTMLASYLLDPEKHRHRLEQIAAERLSRGMTTYDDVTEKRRGSQLSFADVPLERAVRYAADDAEVVMCLVGPMRKALDEAGLTGLLVDIELPLAGVLERMETTGVAIDLQRLRMLGVELRVQTDELEREAHAAAGGPFNLASPKQLAEIMFDRLDLPRIRKTKTGYSTDADVLEELSAHHPLPGKVLQHRSLTRLVSGYIEALPALIHPETGRIHTSYNQAVAATGRLSSSDPNLQNIPVRTDLGRRIRDAFVTVPGWRIVSADYSQIELRVLAHVSRDPLLVDSFRKGEDVHARTAREVFGVIGGGSADQELRRRAKAINFGVIYGKTDFGLAREFGIPKAQARRFIDDYFARYGGVREYMDRTVSEARAAGMVRTMLGRRRFLPQINSRNPTARGQAERMAMNTPIQGTAADIIKIAMIGVACALDREKMRSRMLLTVHDELVFECPAAETNALKALVRETMEGAATLDVPLVVDVGEGETWGEAH
ncbi:MAG: DNA polymerase I [Myxococcota bacterium]|nr:DNA polymerase I [Myxococcota bacterium]